MVHPKHHQGKSGNTTLCNPEYLISPGARNACLSENLLSRISKEPDSIRASNKPISDRSGFLDLLHGCTANGLQRPNPVHAIFHEALF
jgi:hypothetical protein